MHSSPSPKYGRYVTVMENISSKEKSLVQHSVDTLDAKGENHSFESEVDDDRKSRDTASCKELSLQNVHKSIPRHISTFDEKYVLRCLELIKNYSLRAADIDFTSKVDALPLDLGNLVEIRNTNACNMASSAIDTPLGSISCSQSMINILNSPLLKEFGSVNHNLQRKNIREIDYSRCADSSNKEVALVDKKYTSQPVHRRLFSVTSTYSSLSDLSSSASSSSSLSASSFQGMLQCTWKDGMPHYVFTVDDRKKFT